MALLEADMIETVITSMALRKNLRSADSRLIADDIVAVFLELRAYRWRNSRRPQSTGTGP
jgi:hypothetical protein